MKAKVAIVAAMVVLALALAGFFAVTTPDQRWWWCYSFGFPLGSIAAFAFVTLVLYRLHNRIGSIEGILQTQLPSISSLVSDVKTEQFSLRRPLEESMERSRQFSTALDSLVQSVDTRIRKEDRVPATQITGSEPDVIRGSPLEVEAAMATMAGQEGCEDNSPPFPVPISVSDCLQYVKRTGSPVTEAKAEALMGGVLVQSAEGLFLVIGDGANNHPVCVIPRLTRFGTKQDYTHFERFYECRNPSTGDLWIIKPAIASWETGSTKWKLSAKGELEVRF
jgi:hypothetical protein